MTERADAFVFFGATGDLARKMIFPALHRLVAAGRLDIPVIGMAFSGWDVDRLRHRVRESVAEAGGDHRSALDGLLSLVRYVDGDYNDPATFEALQTELGGERHPVHYLAIPPKLFATVVRRLGESGCARGGRVVVEKPFGHDLASAQELNGTLRTVFDEDAIYRIDHSTCAWPTAWWRRCSTAGTSPGSRSRWLKTSGSRTVAASTTGSAVFSMSWRTTCSRSWHC